MARKTAEPIETREITLTVAQWRWLAETWQITVEKRGMGGKITPVMEQSLNKLCSFVRMHTDGKDEKGEFVVKASLPGWAAVLEYLTCIPSSNGLGSKIAAQVSGKMQTATVTIETDDGETVVCVWFERDKPDPTVGDNGAIYINRVSKLVGGDLIRQSAAFRDKYEEKIEDAVEQYLGERHG
jgi:hypothetical protein